MGDWEKVNVFHAIIQWLAISEIIDGFFFIKMPFANGIGGWSH